MALWAGSWYSSVSHWNVYLFTLQEVKDRRKVGDQLNRSNRTQWIGPNCCLLLLRLIHHRVRNTASRWTTGEINTHRFSLMVCMIIISAVKRLITINHIRLKCFCFHYACNVYIYYVYKYTHIRYIFWKYLRLYIYIFVFLYIYIYIYIYI